LVQFVKKEPQKDKGAHKTRGAKDHYSLK
jgi:hypothetical protein